MRILKSLLLSLVGLVLTALLVAFIVDPVATGRGLGTLFGGGLGPTATVTGGPAPDLPVRPAAERTIPQAVLDQAAAFGEQEKSHALLIWHDGALDLEHYYPGHDANSVTPTQSMHKSVLAMLIGIAIQQGLIGSVDDPASKYVSEWAGDDRRSITIRQMLQQDSGIDFPGLVGFARLTLGGNIAPIALDQKLLDPPGTRFDYNGINPEVLGILLQRVTGKPYADYLGENLWRYVSPDKAAVVLDSEAHRIPRTFCCLDTTARAWLRLGLLHLNGGRVGDRQVVPEAWMKEIETPSANNPNYGYFTWLGTTFEKERRYNHKSNTHANHSEPFAAPDVIYFDGFGGQRVYIVPSRKLVIVRTGALRPGWDDAVLPNLIIRALPAPSANPSTDPSATPASADAPAKP